MSQPTITFIGGGNMAQALYGGLLTDGFDAGTLAVIDPSDAAQRQARDSGLTRVHASAGNALNDDLIVLAVKPQIAAKALAPLAGKLGPSSTVLSIIAGVSSASLANMLGLPDTRTIIRSMPNTPALVGEGMAGLFAAQSASASGRDLAETVMSSVGKALWVTQETDLDIITAVSGSGPAYFFLFMESLAEAGVELGLNSEDARQLAVQTAVGAAKLAGRSDEDLAMLRHNVTSPGGTTEQAILSLETAGMRGLVKDAVGAARQRSVELGQETGS